MKFKKQHKIGIALAVLIIAGAFLFKESPAFSLVFGIGIIIGILPFVFSTITETKIAREKEEMFLEFARNLVESVKMGSSISKSILILKNRNYEVLNKHVGKLANQISMGIPLNIAMQTFSKDIGNKKISKAITLIRQAERAGGDIGKILESVAEAVSTTDKLKKERKAAISALMVQGYIIFFVFIIIVLVMQFQILPLVSGLAGTISIGGVETSGAGFDPKEISDAFLDLLLVQGLFSGLIIGKLAEESIKNGVKHSFILMISAFLISTISNALFGG
ncbi:MAG: type II secretion system F family protein [Nanoarchaeota archaeon]|nr:type II secretion system F family protein [Nanoarchaeota archaeon]